MNPLPSLCHNPILTGTEITLAGDINQLERLSHEIAAFCSANALDPEIEFDLNLAMEELFTNSVRHGGCAGMPDAVQIRLLLAPGGVHVEYEDRGSAYNPLDAPEPDIAAPLMDRPPGGLGVYMVRRIMQDLAYRRRGESNLLTMTRRTENV